MQYSPKRPFILAEVRDIGWLPGFKTFKSVLLPSRGDVWGLPAWTLLSASASLAAAASASTEDK